jgi:hypothetical protein
MTRVALNAPPSPQPCVRNVVWDPKAPRPIWYTNPYAIVFREEIAPSASVTLHPSWGAEGGFDAYHPCRLIIGETAAENFQVERLTFDGRPQTLGVHGHGPCPATVFIPGNIPYSAANYETCAFGCAIDLQVRNESAKSQLFVAAITGPRRVAQSVFDEVARADWSTLTRQQRRAILYYGSYFGGGFPRKDEDKKAMEESLLALGLVHPYERGGCLPTARGLALADHLYRSQEPP